MRSCVHLDAEDFVGLCDFTNPVAADSLEQLPDLPWLKTDDIDRDTVGPREPVIHFFSATDFIGAVVILLIEAMERSWVLPMISAVVFMGAGVPYLIETMDKPVSNKHLVPRSQQPMSRPRQSIAASRPIPMLRAAMPKSVIERSRSNLTQGPSLAKPREVHKGPMIQLASYFSRRLAERYWATLVANHQVVGPLQHEVVKGLVNGRTVYRLRASGAGAADACLRLRLAGISCLQIAAPRGNPTR